MNTWRTRSLVEDMWWRRRRRLTSRRRARRPCRGRSGSQSRRRRRPSPSNQPPSRSGRSSSSPPSVRPDDPSCVQSAAGAGVTRASSRGRYPNAGYVGITIYVRRTRSLITRRVCAASRAYSTIVPNRTAVNRVRTIRAVAVQRNGRRDGVVSRCSRASYLACSSTGRCSAARSRWKPATRDIRGRAAVAGLLLTRPKRDSWTAARTFRNYIKR